MARERWQDDKETTYKNGDQEGMLFMEEKLQSQETITSSRALRGSFHYQIVLILYKWRTSCLDLIQTSHDAPLSREA
jgi:hypothetical protein